MLDLENRLASKNAPRLKDRSPEAIRKAYTKSTEDLLKGGKSLVLGNKQVRFIAFRDYALDLPGTPPVLNVKVDPELNPHVMKVVSGKLVSIVSVNGKSANATLSIEDFLKYMSLGIFVFVDFRN